MEENVIQKKREHEESLSSSEDEIALPNKVAKPAFSWTKYEKQREFNEEWTNLFFCIETPDKKKAQCLICLQIVSQKRSLIYYDIFKVNMQNKFQRNILLDPN